MNAGLGGGGDINFGIRTAQLELVSKPGLKGNRLCCRFAQQFIPASQKVGKNSEVQEFAFEIADQRGRVTEIDGDGGKWLSELVRDLKISHDCLQKAIRRLDHTSAGSRKQ